MKATAALAGPLAIAQIATFMMGLVDTACVGRFSEEALGAVGVGNALHWAFSSIALGIPLSLDPLISQSIGAGVTGRGYQWFKKGIVVTLFVSIPLIALELYTSSHLTLFGLPSSLAETANNYVMYRAPALLFFLLFLDGKAYLQSHSITRPILMAAVWANIVNFILDIFLIFGDGALIEMGLPAMGLPALGEVGAGITTTFSSICLAAFVLWKVYQIRPDPSTLPKDTTSKRQVFSVAWPISLQQVGESWLFCGFGVLVGRFGILAASGHQVALSLAASAFMLALGISIATSVRVGHAVGAGSLVDTRRASLSGILLVLMVMTVTAIIFLVFPIELVSLITDKPDVIPIAVPLLAFAAAFALFDGVQAVVGGALRGAGDVRIPFVLSIICYWGVGGTLGWFAMNSPMQVQGIWVGLCGGLMSASVVLSARLFWVCQRPIESVG